MLANYGYKDGAGGFLITIDTDKCNGCGKCSESCPYGVLEVGEDQGDPFREEPVVQVTEEQRKKIRYACAPCKPYSTSLEGVTTEVSAGEMKNLPCVAACGPGAILHS